MQDTTFSPGLSSSESVEVESADVTEQASAHEAAAKSERANRLKRQHKADGTKLRSRLLQTILPAVLVPLLAAGFMGYRIIAQRSEDRIQEQLQNQALLASEGTTAVLNELLDLPRTVAGSPLVINEARAGAQAASEAGLPEMSIEEIEAEFADTKLLRSHDALNIYLQQTVETAEISEILVTDSHGFNVAYSRPVADMVQSDEDWWQNGKENGQWIGPPDFDYASRGFTVELVQAIRDPQNDDSFVGVLRAILPTRKFSLLTETLKRTGISGSQRVQLVDGDRLSTIDTFSAQGFHKDRNIIGGEPVEQFISTFVAATQGERDSANQILSALRSQSDIKNIALPVADEALVMASFTYQGRQYKIANIASSNWVAIASMDRREISETGRDSLLFFSLFTLFLAALTTAIIFWLSRQLSRPISRLTAQAEIATSGNLDIAITPTGTAETRFLTRAFNQLIAQSKSLLQTQRTETEKAQLFADITSTPIFSYEQIEPLLTRTLSRARDILSADRLAFFQVQKDEDLLEPNGWRMHPAHRTWQKGWIAAESVAPELPAASSYLENARWLPEATLSTAADQVPTVVVNSLDNSDVETGHRAFLETAQVKSSLNVPVVYEVSVSGSEQTVIVLWGYLIAHCCQAEHTWEETEIQFLEQLALQLKRVLDRIAASASVRKSHQEVQRSRLETEEITRTQQAESAFKRQQDEQLKQQIEALSQDISGVFQGDLTVRAGITQGELKTVADVFNTTVAKLEELVGQVKGATAEIDEVLSQNEHTARQLAQLTQQQGQDAMRTLETIQAVSQSMSSAVEQAHGAADFAHQVTDHTIAGRDAVNQASQEIKALNAISNSAVSQIQQLTRSSHNVSYMVTMIKSIAAEMQTLANETASQVNNWTNQGSLDSPQSQQLARTTAEMAKLAERASSEAGLIDTFLTSVGNTTTQMSEAIDQINQEVTNSNQTMQTSRQRMSEVLTVAQQFEQLAEAVSRAIEEQSQISQNAFALVTAVVDLSEQASGFSEAIAAALHSTATSAHELRSSVSFFKVNPPQ